jgi:hypothetical protein
MDLVLLTLYSVVGIVTLKCIITILKEFKQILSANCKSLNTFGHP